MKHKTEFEAEKGKSARAGKIAFIGLIAGLAVVLAAAAAIVLNLDRFREPVVAKLSEMTGLKIAVESLGLDFSRGLKLKCVGLKVRTPDGHRQLFSAEEALLELELLPILRGQFNVKDFVLVKPEVRIYPERPGEPAGPPSQTEAPAPPGPAGPPAPKKLTPQQFQYGTIRTFLQTAHLSLERIEIRQGRVVFASSETGPSPEAEKILAVSAGMQFRRAGRDKLDLALTPLALEAGNLRFAGTALFEDMLGQRAALRANLESGPFTIDELAQLRGWLPEAQRQYLDPERFSGKVERLSLDMTAQLDSTANLESLDSLKDRATARINLVVADAGVMAGDVSVPVPRVEGEGQWEKNSLRHQIAGKALEGDFALTGNLTFAKDFSSAAIDSDLKIAGAHLAPIKPAVKNEWFPDEGTVSGTAHVSGPVSDLPGLQWAGKFEGKNLGVKVGEKKHAAEAAVVSIHTVSPGQANLDISLTHVSLDRALLKQVSGLVGITEDAVRLAQGRIFPRHGEIDLSGNYWLSRQTWNAKFNSRGLLSEDLLPEHFAGPLSLSGNLEGGNTPEGPLRGLSGNVKVQFSDGSLRQARFISALLALLNPHSVVDAQKEGLNYKYLGGDFKIRKGETVTNNLELNGPQLKVLVAGKADLPTGALKAEAKAMPLQLVDTVAKAIPLVGKILGGGKKGGVIETYFSMEGTLADPKFTLLPGRTILGKPLGILEELIKLPASLADSNEDHDEPDKINEDSFGEHAKGKG
ncbi:MAG: AsmA-like C-terminal region-containing protein [Nitrospinae bacterium]|nr:AsmA-like C-terminal region-containing protein [Nitrospinota bacterium]